MPIKKTDDYAESTSPLLSDSENLNHTTVATKDVKFDLRLILPAVWIGSFLSAADGTIVSNIMGRIAADFDQEDLKTWVATSYLLTNTAFQPLYGKLSDIIGRKYALLIAQFFFGFGCFLSIFAQSVPQFAISRAISGIGGGGVSAMSSIIVSDVVSLEERGLFQGYANVIYAAGQMIGAPLGGYAYETIGWKWTFGIQAPCVLVCMFLANRNINIKPGKPFTKESFKRIDVLGSFHLILLISSFLLLLSTNLNRLLLFIVLIYSLVAFVYIEKYVAIEQILPAELLLKENLGASFILSFFNAFVLASMLFGIPSFLQIFQNQSTKQSGTFLIFSVFSISLGSLYSGYILKKKSSSGSSGNVQEISSSITFIGEIFVLVSFLVITSTVIIPSPYDTNWGWKIILCFALTVIGFFHGALLVSTLITIVAIVGKEGQASATGLNYLFRSVGQVLGVGISLSVLENYLVANWTKLLANVVNGDVILDKILKNTENLKNGDLINDELRVQLLKVYQWAMTLSFLPSVILSTFAVFIGSWVFLKRRESSI